MDIVESLESFYELVNVDMSENSSNLKGLTIALQWGDIMKTIRRSFPLIEGDNDYIDLNLRMFIQIENDKKKFIEKAIEWLGSQNLCDFGWINNMKDWKQNVKDNAVDEGYLSDWYQASVTDDHPVWTDEHISEVYEDFYMIPKEVIDGKDI